MNTKDPVEKVRWTPCNSSSQSAARLVRYLSRRPERGHEASRESEWRAIPDSDQFGDAERFKEEARRRKDERLRSAEERGKDISQDNSRGNSSYLHIVISPPGREDYREEDWEAVMEPWITDERGTEHAHYAAIHRDDPEGPTMHLAVARDRVQKSREMPMLRERTHEIEAERERLIEAERQREREERMEREREEQRRQAEAERQAQAEREAEQERQREAERQAGAERQREERQREEERNPYRDTGGRDPFADRDTDREHDRDRDR